jgi:NAD(P)-dependent dehydrogenase (short-subunit alcohol dehydrogenase family)
MSQVWLITGCSSGFGRTLAEAALAAGHSVALTARKPDQLAELAAKYPDTAAAFPLDVTDAASVSAAISGAVERFGRLDVLVNNAGYGLLAALEETTDEQLRRNLETNLVGPLRVMRAALPVFRKQGGGRILNLSAVAGFSNELGFSVYGGAKAALEAASDAVAGEAGPFGVRVTCVVPGPFRTDFIGRSLDRGQSMPEYAGTVGKFAGFLGKIDGKQPGDPAKAAAAILKVAADPNPPARLVLGKYAHDKYEKKLAAMRAELDAWVAVGKPTDF